MRDLRECHQIKHGSKGNLREIEDVHAVIEHLELRNRQKRCCGCSQGT